MAMLATVDLSEVCELAGMSSAHFEKLVQIGRVKPEEGKAVDLGFLREYAKRKLPAGYLTTKDAAQLCLVPRERIYQLIYSGEIRAEKFDGAWGVSREEIESIKRAAFKPSKRYLNEHACARELGMDRYFIAKMVVSGSIPYITKEKYSRGLFYIPFSYIRYVKRYWKHSGKSFKSGKKMIPWKKLKVE